MEALPLFTRGPLPPTRGGIQNTTTGSGSNRSAVQTQETESTEMQPLTPAGGDVEQVVMEPATTVLIYRWYSAIEATIDNDISL
jgi:hypothetical protein